MIGPTGDTGPNKLSDWSELVVRGVSKAFGDASGESSAVIRDISLSIKRGDFFCLLGPSGCGKSTLLNLIGGFEEISQGSIFFRGDTPSGSWEKRIGPAGRDRVTIFQDAGAALFPWLTVKENVCFGPKRTGVQRRLYLDKARSYLEIVGLEEDSHKFPYQLSGGMRQRAQIARALIMEPDLLLMDEPFAALDAITRRSLQEELVRIWRVTGATILFITHDIIEALMLGTRVAVMTAGPGATIRQEFGLNLETPRVPTNRDLIEIQKSLEEVIRDEIEKSIARRSTSRG